MTTSIADLNIKTIGFKKCSGKAGRRCVVDIMDYETNPLKIRIPNHFVSKFKDFKIPNPDYYPHEKIDKFSTVIRFKNCDAYGKEKSTLNDEYSLLYNFLLDLDESIIKYMVENSKHLFGKPISEIEIRERKSKIIKISKDKKEGEAIANGKYPPYLIATVCISDMISRGVITVCNGIPNSEMKFNNYTGDYYLNPFILIDGINNFGITWKLECDRVM